MPENHENTPKTHYERLGIDNKATQAEIRQAYLKRARETHPDKKTDKNDEAFKAVQNAYSVLYDEEKRKEYDYHLAHQRPTSPASKPASAATATSQRPSEKNNYASSSSRTRTEAKPEKPKNADPKPTQFSAENGWSKSGPRKNYEERGPFANQEPKNQKPRAEKTAKQPKPFRPTTANRRPTTANRPGYRRYPVNNLFADQSNPRHPNSVGQRRPAPMEQQQQPVNDQAIILVSVIVIITFEPMVQANINVPNQIALLIAIQAALQALQFAQQQQQAFVNLPVHDDQQSFRRRF